MSRVAAFLSDMIELCPAWSGCCEKHVWETTHTAAHQVMLAALIILHPLLACSVGCGMSNHPPPLPPQPPNHCLRPGASCKLSSLILTAAAQSFSLLLLSDQQLQPKTTSFCFISEAACAHNHVTASTYFTFQFFSSCRVRCWGGAFHALPCPCIHGTCPVNTHPYMATFSVQCWYIHSNYMLNM